MEWISVKDRLPENHDEVVIWHGYASIGYIDGNWWYTNRALEEGTVTHWKPLTPPQP